MEELVELRCKYCGAPLDRKEIESDSPYITCPSCGTTQQRLDAKKYMEQMMGQIQSWLSRAMPGGFAMAQAENVDPVARHSIFVSSIKPKVEVEINEYRLALNSVLSSALVVLPFTKGEPPRSTRTPAQAFEFDARLKSVEQMAVDGESRAYIDNGEKIANTYALLMNNSKLLQDTTPGRFVLMANNFHEAAENVRKCKGYEAVAPRLDALANVCMASDMVLNGDTVNCIAKARKAAEDLQNAKRDILSNPQLAMFLRALDIEIDQCKTLADTAEMCMQGMSNDPLKTLELVASVTSIQYSRSPQWDGLLSRKERDWDIIKNIQEIIKAKNGGTIPICSGSGNALIPFWDVDLKYSFETGSFFSKKPVVVQEDLMIPAVFTVFKTALDNPREGLTDIFAAAPESTMMARMKGQEDSISGGAGIGKLADSAAPNSPGTRNVFVPLSTKSEAERLVELYLKQCSGTHSRLKLSKPIVKGLVYVPCDVTGDRIILPKTFDRLAPAVLLKNDIGKLIKI